MNELPKPYTAVILSNHLWSNILGHVRGTLQERCGIILSNSLVIPIRNAADDPYTEFLFDPVEHLAAIGKIEKGLYGSGAHEAAFYHSHPAQAVLEPSKRDLACMDLHPDMVHMIVGSFPGEWGDTPLVGAWHAGLPLPVFVRSSGNPFVRSTYTDMFSRRAWVAPETPAELAFSRDFSGALDLGAFDD